MPPTWTTEQVLALSPDSGSTQNGKKLASVSKWQSLGCHDQILWGECQGSGKTPYRTQIDLSEPAFNCSCPSRKFPCKHALGLFLIYTAQPESFKPVERPDWVQTWVDKRNQRQQAKADKNEKAAPKDPKAQAKRLAQREAKVQAGIEDLKLWLQDLIRGGLAAVQSESYSFWDAPAARLVDAQAPGLARQIRELAGIPYSGDQHWPARLLERLGSIYLLLEGYQRLESLSPGTQADVRTAVGWNQNQEDLLADETALVERDQWLILGRRLEAEGNLQVQRTWLWGRSSQRVALSLSFSASAYQPLDVSLVPGTELEAELVFFPSAYPRRALVKTRHGDPQSIKTMVGYPTITHALDQWQQALAHQPWLGTFPMSLRKVTIVPEADQWFICDQANASLPISRLCSKVWELFALSGGHPVDLFGEWDQQQFVPLSAFADQQFWRVTG